ncbi:hypothetical protein Tco_0195241 [Tanacetum coccineum]
MILMDRVKEQFTHLKICLDHVPLIFEAIGKVAYRLELPEKLDNIHNTFHVSQLRKCLVNETTYTPLEKIVIDENLSYIEGPIKILDTKVRKLRNKEAIGLLAPNLVHDIMIRIQSNQSRMGNLLYAPIISDIGDVRNALTLMIRQGAICGIVELIGKVAAAEWVLMDSRNGFDTTWGQKAIITLPLPSEEASPVVKGPLDASKDTFLSLRSKDPNFKIQKKAVEYVRALNDAPLDLVFAGPVDEVRGKFVDLF